MTWTVIYRQGGEILSTPYKPGIVAELLREDIEPLDIQGNSKDYKDGLKEES